MRWSIFLKYLDKDMKLAKENLCSEELAKLRGDEANTLAKEVKVEGKNGLENHDVSMRNTATEESSSSSLKLELRRKQRKLCASPRTRSDRFPASAHANQQRNWQGRQHGRRRLKKKKGKRSRKARLKGRRKDRLRRKWP